MSKRHYQSNHVRIIAGKWRGRLIKFPDNGLIRPTSDRLKETLFNWLSPYLLGATCLDLFAGSGSLGFEALSRGADHCDFVDDDQNACKHLQQSAEKLETESSVRIIRAKVPMMDSIFEQSYQIVFLDPPFQTNMVGLISDWIHQHNMVAKKGLIYVERSKDNQTISEALPWQQLKSKHAGNVSMELYQRVD